MHEERSLDDISFGQLAVDRGFVTQAQVDDALKTQSKLRAMGVTPKKLGKILVEQAYITGEQAGNILLAQKELESCRRIPGYEIHDELGQDLLTFKLDLRRLKNILENNKQPATEIADKMLTMIDLTIQKARQLCMELRPNLLDQLGLLDILNWLVEEFQKTTGISCMFTSTISDIELPSDYITAFFRITQEAISNIIRHSEAKKVVIGLESNDNECIFYIKDDGKGFNVGEITSINASGRGAGLFGMKERVTLVNGECSIDSRPNEGTKIVVKVPIIRPNADVGDRGGNGL